MPGTNAIQLSININKIALIRNSRTGNNPDISTYANRIIDAGANGITVHPRPDQRHIRPEDCEQLAVIVKQLKKSGKALEFNIEGNPLAPFTKATRSDFSNYPGFMKIVESCVPDQVTLVPDSNQQLTSDHGFDLSGDILELKALIKRIKQLGCRVSLFMDPDLEQIKRLADIGADRIEIYTGPFAEGFTENPADRKIFDMHCRAAELAHESGLGINAGHDLNLQNLTIYKTLPYLAEVSIGHAFTIDSLDYGLRETINKYQAVLNQSNPSG